jgi:hypothetical protein
MQMQDWRRFIECSRRQAEIAQRLFLRMRPASTAIAFEKTIAS